MGNHTQIFFFFSLFGKRVRLNGGRNECFGLDEGDLGLQRERW